MRLTCETDDVERKSPRPVGDIDLGPSVDVWDGQLFEKPVPELVRLVEEEWVELGDGVEREDGCDHPPLTLVHVALRREQARVERVQVGEALRLGVLLVRERVFEDAGGTRRSEEARKGKDSCSACQTTLRSS